MKLLINTVAGSRSYKLDTPESDYDTRGVFATEDESQIFGLSKRKVTINSSSDDGVLWELVHFFNMLKNGNTQTMEILFSSSENIIQCEPLFKSLVIDHKHRFLDIDQIITSLHGYSIGESKKTFEHHGSHGEKRRNNIEKHGYSQKNAVQCIRLLQCGIWFLQDGEFYVDITKKSTEFRNLLFEIKTNPSNFSIDEIKKIIEEKQQGLKVLEKNNKVHDQFKFDTEYVIYCIKSLYDIK